MTINTDFTLKKIKNSQSEKNSHFVDIFLRKICEDSPLHTDKKIIRAKLVIIGRTYAASLERTNNDDIYHDDIYKTTIDKMYGGEFDKQLSELKDIHLPLAYEYSDEDLKTVSKILKVHSSLTDIFKEASGIEKISLASKYLYFHFPDLYFIYDSRSSKAISNSTKPVGLDYSFSDCNIKYAKFFLRVLSLRNKIYYQQKIQLTPMQMDNLFLERQSQTI